MQSYPKGTRDNINCVHYSVQYKYSVQYQGCMQDFSGGGGVANFKISGVLDIHAAKLRAFAKGVWGHAPQIFFKWCNFVRFEDYFQPLSW